MTCECCGRRLRFTFSVLSRVSGVFYGLDWVCSDCVELVNEEYYCGLFRNPVSFDVLSVDLVGDLSIGGLLVA
jgi:hypothetical protein